MASIGEKLRNKRLDQGLELSDVSAKTKISAKFLAAIEADDRQILPGGFFYRNWVHQYAQALSLDADKISSEVDQILLAEQAPPLPGQRSRSINELRPAPILMDARARGGNRLLYSFVLLVVVVLGCSGFYVWWHQNEDARVEPSKSSPPAPVPIEKATSPAAVAPAPKPTKAAQHESKPAEAPVQQVSAGDVQLEISATEATWVSISGDGKPAFSGIMQAAESKTVAAHEEAKLRVGNAGGLQVRLNGKSIGPIGPAGQVRTVIFNKSGFQILESKPASASLGVQS